MGYIKEPEGVDFLIKGKPLSDKQKKEISAFIKADKLRLEKGNLSKKRSNNLKKSKIATSQF